MASRGSRIIVIGASSGGLQTVADLAGQFPSGFSASVFTALHMAPDALGKAFLDRVQGQSRLKCLYPENGHPFQPGHIYLAPPDHHMLVKKGKILVTKGARENRFRPSIDTLFRSAAVAYGPAVIGIVLTGMLDDGSLGLGAIKQCGGISMVQDPGEASYPSMPQNALNRVHVDYSLPLSEMGPVLQDLIGRPKPKQVAVPPILAMESRIAERVASNLESVGQLGKQAPYNCPGCGGVLWKVTHSRVQRYRCHVGHAYTISSLVQDQSEKIEETLWMALRMFEERKNLLMDLSRNDRQKGLLTSSTQRIDETKLHIERIQDILISSEKLSKWKRKRE